MCEANIKVCNKCLALALALALAECISFRLGAKICDKTEIRKDKLDMPV